MTTAILPALSGINYANYSKSLKLLCVFMAMLALCGFGFYAYLINNISAGAYLVKNFEKEMSGALRQNAALQANLAEIEFLGSVGRKAKQMGFVEIEAVKYIQVPSSGPMAKAK